MSRAPRPANPSPSVAPDLRSLGPEYVEALHGRHAAVLLKVLSDRSTGAAKNVALAGHYGSGKSSVILGVQAGLSERKVSWVNLSLSSLAVEDTEKTRIRDDGTLTPLTNLIQKEIVKQLLYRKSPADMPGSRYFRIDSFRPAQALPWTIATTVGVLMLASLAGLAGRAAAVLPVALLDGRPWVPWATVAMIAALAGGFCFLILRSLHSRVQIDSVSAGGAAISLSARENSYFDEYLDEIVYFFQRTKTEVAIFEDLDRFKDPYIFETLRELNTVLNNSEQVKARPVRFVYAVRDSIFERLEAVRPDADSGTVTADVHPSPRAEAQESAPSSNRTKFFDLVVPMVPFITHRSARDLLVDEFGNTPQPPSAGLVNLVSGARALTDMRLIRNIRNEYEIYRTSVLSDAGLKGLTPDRLFAMMVYKNTHLEDFEAIRLGTSQIDAAHRAFRDLVAYQVRHQAALSRRALAQANSLVPWSDRVQKAGGRLQQVLPILHRANPYASGKPHLAHVSGTYTMDSLTSEETWKQLLDSREPVQLDSGGYTTALTIDELLLLAGDAGLVSEESIEGRATELERSSRAALQIKDFVTRATMAELLARSDLTKPFGDDARSLRETMSTLVSPLALDLLAAGYIDENYTLYCSDYHDVALSLSAMNFILHCVQPDRADSLFQFDEASSIDAVALEMGGRFLKGESVFNVAVFEHYLAAEDGRARLAEALDRLTTRASSGDTSFIDLVIAEASIATSEQLVGELASRWTGLFVYLAEQLDEREIAIALVGTAVLRAVPGGDYESSDQVRRFVREHYETMEAFVGPIDEGRAAELAGLLRRLGVAIPRLDALGQKQLSAVTSAALYPVTRENLAAALGEEDALALDVVKSRDRRVYDHVKAYLEQYAGILGDGDVTVEDLGSFLDVLNDIAGAPDNLVEIIALRAVEACEVADLDGLDPSVWPSVVSADRSRKSAYNMSRFVSELGLTPELCKTLVGRDLVEVDGLDEQPRVELASAVVEASSLTPEERVRLVRQLRLVDYLAAENFGAEGITVLPHLLAADQVPDDIDTYALIADRPYAFREEYLASSARLEQYVTQLPLSSSDLVEVMRSRSLRHAVKRAVADDADFVAGRLSPAGAGALCQWAVQGNEISTDLLLAMSQAGAPVEPFLVVLSPHLRAVGMADLDIMLQGLGGDLEPLTRRGRHSPRLAGRPGVEQLLDELIRRQRVSSYKKAAFGGFHVFMKR